MNPHIALRHSRELRDFSQSFVAYKLGITVTAYGKIERGQTELSASYIRQLAVILGVDEYKFFTFQSEINELLSKKQLE